MAFTPEDQEYIRDLAERRVRSLSQLGTMGTPYNWETGRLESRTEIDDYVEDLRERRRRRREEERQQRAESRSAALESLRSESEVNEAMGGGSLLDRGLGALGGLARLIDIPGAAVRSAVRETVDWAKGDGWDTNEFRDQFNRREGFGHLFVGGDDDDTDGVLESIGQGLLGFVGDVALDPLTYVTAGGASVVRKTLAEAAGGAVGREVAERAVREGGERAIRESVEQLAPEVAARTRAQEINRALDRFTGRGSELPADDIARRLEMGEDVRSAMTELGLPGNVADSVLRDAERVTAVRGAQARMAAEASRSGARGIRRALLETTGEIDRGVGNVGRRIDGAVGEELFDQLPDMLRGGLGVRSLFGSRAHGPGRVALERRFGGGGRLMAMAPGAGRVADMADAARQGVRRYTSRGFRSFHRGGASYAEAVRQVSQNTPGTVGRGWSTYLAQAEAERLFRQPMTALERDVTSAFREAGMFFKRGMPGVDGEVANEWFGRMVRNIGDLPAQRAAAVEAGISAEAADTLVEAASRFHSGIFGRISTELQRTFGDDVGYINDYFPRIITDEGREGIARGSARATSKPKGGKYSPTASRTGMWARYEVDPTTGQWRDVEWLSVDEINETMRPLVGGDTFLEDPIVAAREYWRSIRPVIRSRRFADALVRSGAAASSAFDTTAKVVVGQRALRMANDATREVAEALRTLRDAKDPEGFRAALSELGFDADLPTTGWSRRRDNPDVWDGPEIRVDLGGETQARMRVQVRRMEREGRDERWQVEVPGVEVIGDAPSLAQTRAAESARRAVERAGKLDDRAAAAVARYETAREALSKALEGSGQLTGPDVERAVQRLVRKAEELESRSRTAQKVRELELERRQVEVPSTRVTNYRDRDEVARAVEAERTPYVEDWPDTPERPAELDQLARRVPEPALKIRQVEPEEFHEAITAAAATTGRNGRKVGETVEVKELEDYADARLFLTEDGRSGMAIMPDGDAVSLFSLERGRAQSLMQHAIREGGWKLDAFDEGGFLPILYRTFGFKEYGRVAWNPDYTPPGWTGGTPDVVMMRLDPELLADAIPFMPASRTLRSDEPLDDATFARVAQLAADGDDEAAEFLRAAQGGTSPAVARELPEVESVEGGGAAASRAFARAQGIAPAAAEVPAGPAPTVTQLAKGEYGVSLLDDGIVDSLPAVYGARQGGKPTKKRAEELLANQRYTDAPGAEALGLMDGSAWARAQYQEIKRVEHTLGAVGQQEAWQNAGIPFPKGGSPFDEVIDRFGSALDSGAENGHSRFIDEFGEETYELAREGNNPLSGLLARYEADGVESALEVGLDDLSSEEVARYVRALLDMPQPEKLRAAEQRLVDQLTEKEWVERYMRGAEAPAEEALEEVAEEVVAEAPAEVFDRILNALPRQLTGREGEAREFARRVADDETFLVDEEVGTAGFRAVMAELGYDAVRDRANEAWRLVPREAAEVAEAAPPPVRTFDLVDEPDPDLRLEAGPPTTIDGELDLSPLDRLTGSRNYEGASNNADRAAVLREAAEVMAGQSPRVRRLSSDEDAALARRELQADRARIEAEIAQQDAQYLREAAGWLVRRSELDLRPGMFASREEAQAAADAATRAATRQLEMEQLQAGVDAATEQLSQDMAGISRMLDPASLPATADEFQSWMNDFADQMMRTLDISRGSVDALISEGRRIPDAYKALLRERGLAELGQLQELHPVLAREMQRLGMHGDEQLGESLKRMWDFRRADTQNEAWEKFRDGVYAPLFGLFKTLATVQRGPGYVARNIYGGIWNAYLTGVTPSNFATSGRILSASARARRWAEENAPTRAELELLFDRRFREELAGMKGVSAERADEMYRAYREFERLGLGAEDVLAEKTSAFAARGVADQRGGSRAERDVLERAGLTTNLRPGKTPDELNRFERGVNAVANNPWGRLMARPVAWSEDLLRLGTFLNGASRYGLDDGGWGAAMMVKASQFDYSREALTDIELKYLKNLLPFYIFSRHSVPLNARAILSEPGKLNRLFNAHEEAKFALGLDEEDDDYFLPDWMRLRNGFVVQGSDGAPLSNGPLVASIESPLMDLNRWAADPVGEVFAQSNPILKTIFEAGSGVDTFTKEQHFRTGDVLGVEVPDVLGLESGMLASAINDTIPTFGQIERVAPQLTGAIGAALGNEDASERYRERQLTSVLSQTTAIPLATLTPSQEDGAIYGAIEAARRDRRRGGDDYEREQLARELLRAGWDPAEVRVVLSR